MLINTQLGITPDLQPSCTGMTSLLATYLPQTVGAIFMSSQARLVVLVGCQQGIEKLMRLLMRRLNSA